MDEFMGAKELAKELGVKHHQEIYHIATTFKVKRRKIKKLEYLNTPGRKFTVSYNFAQVKEIWELQKLGYMPREVRMILKDPLYKKVSTQLELAKAALGDIANQPPSTQTFKTIEKARLALESIS